jgi:hypothetical protein
MTRKRSEETELFFQRPLARGDAGLVCSGKKTPAAFNLKTAVDRSFTFATPHGHSVFCLR